MREFLGQLTSGRRLGWGLVSVRLAIVAMALAVLGGCTNPITIKPLLEQPSAGRYNVIAIGVFYDSGGPFGYRSYPVDSDDKLYFYRRLVEALRGSKAFAEVLDPAPALIHTQAEWRQAAAVLPASALLLTAKLWRKETGGAGDLLPMFPARTYYGANVVLRDSKADDIVSFKLWWEVRGSRVRARRLDRAELDTVFRSLADETAAAIVRWSRGESLAR